MITFDETRQVILDILSKWDGQRKTFFILGELWKAMPPEQPGDTDYSIPVLADLERERFLLRRSTAPNGNHTWIVGPEFYKWGKSKSKTLDVERIAAAVGDESTPHVMAIANDSTKSVRERLEILFNIDPRLKGKTTIELSQLLVCSESAVRNVWSSTQQKFK